MTKTMTKTGRLHSFPLIRSTKVIQKKLAFSSCFLTKCRKFKTPEIWENGRFEFSLSNPRKDVSLASVTIITSK